MHPNAGSAHPLENQTNHKIEELTNLVGSAGVRSKEAFPDCLQTVRLFPDLVGDWQKAILPSRERI